ncbi:hypothetical protein [Geothrix alkalitolerans]|uniref:hypothetical protein n=1 Tax=Geothrix alkalitolerans TaxID=2922724 RepID=UPI001FAE9A6F|nr:hypothetical protein [Geothrix alkalitolerans]
MGSCLPLLFCCSLSLHPAFLLIGQEVQTGRAQSDESLALGTAHSISLEGVLYESGKSEIYSATFEFSTDGIRQLNDSQPGYVLEYLYSTGESIKTTCQVRRSLAWTPRNDKDIAHSWYALVPSNRQGIGYRILRGSQVISEQRFTAPNTSIQFDCDETPPQGFTWRVHANIAEIAISFDRGKSWQVTPAMRSSAGTISLPLSQLQANPHPWILLQGSANGVIYTKFHVFGFLRPS